MGFWESRRLRPPSDLPLSGPLLALLLAIAPAHAAATKAVLRIEPGPVVMTVDEQHIAQDVSRGTQHGVILIDETLRDEDSTLTIKLSHHVRAKILSNEGRGLADIVIPYDTRTWHLDRWWGRTILPDGSVIELKREDLFEQTLIEARGWRVRILKAALPGVVPGCVIDYGYILSGGNLDDWVSIPLQQRWPVREFRYQWFPANWLPSQYFVRKTKGIQVDVTRQKTGVFIEGNELPSFVDEPWMPPDDLVRAGVTLFYSFQRPTADPDAFWDVIAREKEDAVALFLKKDKALRTAIEEMRLPPDATLEGKLGLVYDWLDRNVGNRSMLKSEEDAAAEEQREKIDWKKKTFASHETHTAGEVLGRREADRSQIRHLFIGFARALGASASLVLAPDRRERLWERSLLSRRQLSSEVVAVHDPGQPDASPILVDPGSGLPFGAIPWWLTPTRALVAGAGGAGEIDLPHSYARHNVMESHATISFPEENPEIPRVAWWAKGTGQRGYQERLSLRKLEPKERGERLQSLCGASGDFEILKADAPDLDDFRAQYRLECQGEMASVLIDDSLERIQLGIAGNWIPEPPRFPSTSRHHPVVFSYPLSDVTTIDAEAPPGFTTRPPPQVVNMETPFGAYRLRFSRMTGGYRVDRAFTLNSLTVGVADYEALRAFLERVRVADSTPIAFVRSEDVP